MRNLVELVARDAAIWLLFSLLYGNSAALSVEAAEKTPTIEEVKARLREQIGRLESLHLRVRRETAFAEERDDLKHSSGGRSATEYAGADVLLEAFKGDKRYQRIVELNYSPSPFDQPDTDTGQRRYFDIARAWTGNTLLERCTREGSGHNGGAEYRRKFLYRATAAESVKDAFPPSTYLANVGLAFPDPTATHGAQRNLQQMANISDLLRRWPYEIVVAEDVIDGHPCVVLKGEFCCPLPFREVSETASVSDKLWLDLKFNFALRKRQTYIDEKFTSVINRDFVEVLPELWLPKQSELRSYVGNAFQGSPAVVRTMILLFWVANAVPDDIFDVALTRPKRTSLFDQANAFHWHNKLGQLIIEGWALRDVGVRIEYRGESSGKPQMVVVETPRWRYQWQRSQNRVTVQPSSLRHSDGYSLISPNAKARDAIVRENEVITGVFSCRVDRLGDREVERLLVHLPADPLLQHAANLHHADPGVLRRASPTIFYTRRYWFDRETKLLVARQCGCKGTPDVDSTYEPAIGVDYPQSENLPLELFRFEIPAAADVTVIDPALGRVLRSAGEPKRAKGKP